MKKYIDQIFNEGLGYSLYLPVESKINKIKDVKKRRILYITYRTFYLILSLIIFIAIIIYKL